MDRTRKFELKLANSSPDCLHSVVKITRFQALIS
jgi:hypothetical protein